MAIIQGIRARRLVVDKPPVILAADIFVAPRLPGDVLRHRHAADSVGERSGVDAVRIEGQRADLRVADRARV